MRACARRARGARTIECFTGLFCFVHIAESGRGGGDEAAAPPSHDTSHCEPNPHALGSGSGDLRLRKAHAIFAALRPQRLSDTRFGGQRGIA